jgi:hypothetical protein
MHLKDKINKMKMDGHGARIHAYEISIGKTAAKTAVWISRCEWNEG